MPYAIDRGCRIAFDVVGDGPTVVLQGGLTSRKLDVARLGYVDAFAHGYQVVNIDSLGHGDSDKPFDLALYGSAQRAGDITAVLDELEVEHAHVVGYSMGGWVVSAMIIHRPERVASAAVEPAVRCCWDALEEVLDIEPALSGFGRPVLLWNGTDDNTRDGAARLATRHHTVHLLETPGDHMSAWFNDDGTGTRGLRSFIDTVART